MKTVSFEIEGDDNHSRFRRQFKTKADLYSLVHSVFNHHSFRPRRKDSIDKRPSHIQTYFRYNYEEIDANYILEVLWEKNYVSNKIDGHYNFIWRIVE